MASRWDQHWNSTKINYDIFNVGAEYFIECYEKHFGFSESDIILDFGAGKGDIAPLLKDKVHKIYLFDKSEISTDNLKNRFSNFENIYILNDLTEIKESVSVIIINSVIQYMSKNEVEKMLADLKKISGSNTKLIISDALPMGYTKLNDALHMLKISLKNGFFLKFAINMVTSIINSPKLSLKTSSLQIYDKDEIRQILLNHGYNSVIMEKNFAYSANRYTIYCTPSSRSTDLRKQDTITI